MAPQSISSDAMKSKSARSRRKPSFVVWHIYTVVVHQMSWKLRSTESVRQKKLVLLQRQRPGCGSSG